MTRRLLAALSFAALLAASACTAAPSSTATLLEVSLDASPAGLTVAPHLPASLTFSDRMGAAQVAQLPSALPVAASPEVSTYRAGDVAYSFDEHALVVFTVDGAGAGETRLVRVGRVAQGLAELSGCVRDCTVALVTEGSATSR
ncbi:cyclophilin-like fold protein [Tessaracoccus sp. G1721]